MKPNISELIKNLENELIDFFDEKHFLFSYQFKLGQNPDTILVRNDKGQLYPFKYEVLASVVEKTNLDNGRLLAKFNIEETRHFILNTITGHILKEMEENKTWYNFKKYFLENGY